jgi:hypothetical protein
MDKFQFTQSKAQFTQPSLADALARAKQNPRAFEETVRKNNPQAYQQALSLRNTFANPQQAVMQIAQQRGINPNILRMLDV